MISDKETNTIYLSKRIESDYPNTFKELSERLISFNSKPILLPKTKDIWARDYMPIQISENKFIEYRYDPDYLQKTRKGFRDLKTYPDIVCDAINLKPVKTEIILDGGNVVKSKNCIILTDKIVHENRLLCNKTELLSRLRETFEVDKVVLIPWFEKEKFGHSDGVLRFIDDSTVLINPIERTNKELQRQIQQNGINIEWLEYSVKQKDKRNWAYINFLQTKDLIIVPKLNIEEDGQALEQIKKHYDSYTANDRIAQVDMTEIVKEGGALNCITWTIKS